MFEQAHCLLLDKLRDHVAEDSPHSIEPLVCVTDVAQSDVIKEDFLNDEYRHRFAEFRSRFHDAETQRNDLSSKQKIDDIG